LSSSWRWSPWASLDPGTQDQATTSLTLTPDGGGTRITWAFDSNFEGNFLGRYFGLMLDQFVGADYEKGLVRLKALAEASVPADAPPMAAPEFAPQSAAAGSPAGQDTPVPPSPQ
jgi:hypothetical protein